MILRRRILLAMVAAAAVVVVNWTRGAASLPCTPMPLEWLQADTAGWIIAVATGDSALANRRDQYGQWATVEHASDSRSVGKRALIVTWDLSSMCDPMPSGRALGFPAGTRFFVGGSLRERDPGGVAIHDITAFTPTYVAAWVRDSSGTPLSLEEYVTFYMAMPTKAQWFANPVAFARRLRAWARFTPLLATRPPVPDVLESMETDYALTMHERREEGTWPGDALIQEPGSLLRPGMRLIYRGDTEQRWTIDSLSPDTTLAGARHCVRMRLRLSADAPMSTRAFCARDGLLHAYDERSAQLRAVRPLRPGRQLTTRAANGTVSLFETDSLTVEMVAGRAVEWIGTTVTTRDSTGRVVRRLRERFAPALLTATEGTFEVPDSTQAGGWRVTSRFRLAEINR